jgi:hypothetical protein
MYATRKAASVTMLTAATPTTTAVHRHLRRVDATTPAAAAAAATRGGLSARLLGGKHNHTSSSSAVVCRANKTSRDDSPLKAPDRAPGRGMNTNDVHKREGFAALRLLDLDTVRRRWDVPWGGWRVLLGIGGWSLSFVLTAAVVFPILLGVNGGGVLINRYTYQVNPFYLSSETVLPIKPFYLSNATCAAT